jgi:hypothetical protein
MPPKKETKEKEKETKEKKENKTVPPSLLTLSLS